MYSDLKKQQLKSKQMKALYSQNSRGKIVSLSSTPYLPKQVSDNPADFTYGNN